MKVKIFPKDDIREGVPIELEIESSHGAPKVYVENLGEVDVVPSENGYRASFWTMEKGDYALVVKDQRETQSQILRVHEQSYLTFNQEFGLFLPLLLFFLLGVIIWIKKFRVIKK